MSSNRNTYSNEDFVYMCKLLQNHEIVLEKFGTHSIALVKTKNNFQEIEEISEILNSYLEIKEEDKSNRWVSYNHMAVFSPTWKHFKEEYVFGNPVKAIIHYCESIGKEESTFFRRTDLQPESETLKHFLELSEKMTRVGLTLTPEQENTLLHNVIDELSAEIASLKLKIEDLS